MKPRSATHNSSKDGIASGRYDGYLANTGRGTKSDCWKQRVWWLDDNESAKDWKGRI